MTDEFGKSPGGYLWLLSDSPNNESEGHDDHVMTGWSAVHCFWMNAMISAMKRYFYIIFIISVLLADVGYTLWCAMPHFSGSVCGELASQTPLRQYYDGMGKLILREPTYDGQWRFDVELEDISPEVVEAILGVEDSRFWSHDGVDRLAILRAIVVNLRFGHITSGASTVTMQLAGMTLGRERTLLRKFRQAACARRIEWEHSKKWILANYLNRIPFGGKMHGIEAASRYYFGMPSKLLSFSEATLLCGIPQRPNAYRPDRHLAAARRRQKMVLLLLERNGVISALRGRRVFRDGLLRFRDFSLPSPLKIRGLHRNNHFLMLARRESENALEVHTSWNLQWQNLLHTALKSAVERLDDVADGAGIIIDNETGEVQALVGTLDYSSSAGGQVNAATSRRCAGSSLKPFVYAEAIDGGLLCADTIVYDKPLRYGDYAPGNYDGTYQLEVTAEEALCRSLNTPAIRLVVKLGTVRVLDMFSRLGLQRWNFWRTEAELAQKLGLSLVLGTGGYRLADMAAAYSTLANGGKYVRQSYLRHNGQRERKAIFTEGTSAMVTKMLMKRPLNCCEFDVAWKTGTSSGNCDAWCFAYTPEVTVGIWLGNKDGHGADALVGAEAAAPCAEAVISALFRNAPPEEFNLDKSLVRVDLCTKTGLRAIPGICESKIGIRAIGVPLRQCRRCLKGEKRQVTILKPMPKTYVAGEDGTVRLPLKASEANVHWYVDGTYCGMNDNNKAMTFHVGKHRLNALSEDEGVMGGTVEFQVIPKGARSFHRTNE